MQPFPQTILGTVSIRECMEFLFCYHIWYLKSNDNFTVKDGRGNDSTMPKVVKKEAFFLLHFTFIRIE